MATDLHYDACNKDETFVSKHRYLMADLNELAARGWTLVPLGPEEQKTELFNFVRFRHPNDNEPVPSLCLHAWLRGTPREGFGDASV